MRIDYWEWILALKEFVRSPHSKLIANAVGAHVIRGHSGQCNCIFYLPVTLCFVFMRPVVLALLSHSFTISLSLNLWCREIPLLLMTMILLAVAGYKWVWISVISTSKSWQLEMMTMCHRCKLHYQHTANKTIFKTKKRFTQKLFFQMGKKILSMVIFLEWIDLIKSCSRA